MQVVILGHVDAVDKLRNHMRFHGSPAFEIEPDGCVLADWDVSTEDSWLSLVRVCYQHGCVPVPVTDEEQARRLVDALCLPVEA